MSCKDLYVGLKGTDNELCGSSADTPCFTLSNILQKAENHDVIYIDGNGTNHQSLNICSENATSKSLSIIGYGPMPHITCLQKPLQYPIFKFTSMGNNSMYEHCINSTTNHLSQVCAISVNKLKHIHFEAGFILVKDVEITIMDSVFDMSSLVLAPVGLPYDKRDMILKLLLVAWLKPVCMQYHGCQGIAQTSL